jgi:hypothetical protein
VSSQTYSPLALDDLTKALTVSNLSGAVRYAITSIELWTLRVRDCLRAKHVDVVPNSWPSNVGPSGKKMAGSRGFQASGFAPPILDTR